MTPLNEVLTHVSNLRVLLLSGSAEELDFGARVASNAIGILMELKSTGGCTEQIAEFRHLIVELAVCQKLVEHGLESTRILTGILNAGSGEYMRDPSKFGSSVPATFSVRG
jgi:hypothetical protein